MLHPPTGHGLAQVADFQIKERAADGLEFLVNELIDALMHQGAQGFRIDIRQRVHGGEGATAVRVFKTILARIARTLEPTGGAAPASGCRCGG